MSKQASSQTPSSESSGSATITPASTPKSTSDSTTSVRFADLKDIKSPLTMEEEPKDQKAVAADLKEREEQPSTETRTEPAQDSNTCSKKTCKCNKHKKAKSKHSKKSGSKKTRDLDSDSSDSSSSSDSDSSDSSDSSSEEDTRKKRKGKSKKGKDKKGKRRSKKVVEESDEDSDAEEAEEESAEEAATNSAAVTYLARVEQQMSDLKAQLLVAAKPKTSKKIKALAKTKSKKVSKAGFSSKFKRVDELWDTTIHNYKLKESAEEDDSEFAEFAFLVKRTFDWENKYRDTDVVIKSKVLRTALQGVMKDCKCVSLEVDEPKVDPKILFLYLEELRTHYKKTLKAKIKSEKKRKVVKNLEQQRSLLKTLIGYIDEDFADTKKTLYPLLKAGKITFELCWALFHPNDVAITSTYGSWEEPRCFKVDYAIHCRSFQRGEWYCIEGKYVEIDGKGFGHGDFEVDIDSFQGPRKITSLATYPLKYHTDPEGVKKKIIARGEQFIRLEGMHYMCHKGMAFHKKKKQVLKINIKGRVMIDPASFRRINPNYPISQVMKRKDGDDLFSFDSDSDSDSDGCCCGSDSEDGGRFGEDRSLEKKHKDSDSSPKYKYSWQPNSKGRGTFVRVEVDADGDPIYHEKHVDKMAVAGDDHSFTEDELLLTSPVVLGFAFSEKLWLEFTITGITPIDYQEGAFDSLVLPPDSKSIVRALVESHKNHGTKTIDDVVQGKGKGLVAVLHGPPGTGKTLTAESISELLKCPLYMVSAGELGTDPGRLEAQLQQVLDMAHSWGAILLLDEADVFLEQRESHDIHRNALVSIFLRLLEYFQGILFLTTNRVQTFDSAFQSRIHVALRYEELTTKAKKTVWQMFLDMAAKVEGMEVGEITDSNLDDLSRKHLNGRQIKNLVRTAQALALNEKQKLTMSHIKRALDVAETFDRDFKGGTGYMDAMRSYT